MTKLDWAWLWVRASMVLLASALVTGSAMAATLYFPHADADYLYPTQHEGGAALVPENPGEEPLPVVVFLHGVNPRRQLHLWFGGGATDLRPVAKRLYRSNNVRPFILAGPSQTRSAQSGSRLWSNFDLADFVEDVARAVDGRATVDRESVVFLGHSGAGCSARGGLASQFWAANRPLPLALVAIDPCLDAKVGEALSRRPAGVPLWLMWQSAVWPRQPAVFRRALAERPVAGRIDRIEELRATGANPHESIVPVALERAVRGLLAKREQASGAS